MAQLDLHPVDPCPGCAAPDLAFAPHDHAHCSSDALQRAEAVIAAKGLRMTPVRRRTLEILLEAHRALGAYDVLNRLSAEGYGNQPPVAYRALEFLEKQGFAHRIESLNAYVACRHGETPHVAAFLICDCCKSSSEIEAAGSAELSALGAAQGFVLSGVTIEGRGLCAACSPAA